MTSPTPRYLYLFTVQGQANHLMLMTATVHENLQFKKQVHVQEPTAQALGI